MSSALKKAKLFLTLVLALCCLFAIFIAKGEKTVVSASETSQTITGSTEFHSGDWESFVDVGNWKFSHRKLQFDFLPSDDSSSVQLQFNKAPTTNTANSVTLSYSGSASVGTVIDIGDGWYRYEVDMSDLSVASDNDGTETFCYLRFRNPGAAITVDNVDTTQYAVHSINANSSYRIEYGWDFETVSGWKNSQRCLQFDYKPASASGTVTIQFENKTVWGSNMRISSTFSLDLSSNTGFGTVTALEGGWYHCEVNISTLGERSGSNNDIAYAGQALEILYLKPTVALQINNISVKEFGVYSISAGSTVTLGYGGWHFEQVANWSSSNKVLQFDYKPAAASGNMRLRLYYPEDRCSGETNIYYDNNTAQNNGLITALDNGWYHFCVKVSNFPVRSGSGYGAQTFTRLEMKSVTSACEIKNIDTTADACTVTVTNGTGGGVYGTNGSVTVVADTIANKTFRGWSVDGNLVSVDSSYTFTVTEDIALTAVYGEYAISSATFANGTWSTFVEVEEWNTSNKFFKIDFKPSTSSSEDHVELQLQDSSGNRVSEVITIYYDGTTNLSDTKYAIESIGGGWYRLKLELNALGEHTGYADATISQIRLRSMTAGIAVYGADTTETGVYYTVTLNGAGTGSTGAGKYLAGSSVTVTPGTVAGKTFTEWRIGGEQVSTDSSYTFTPSGNVTLTAVFNTSYTVTVTNGTGGGTYVEGSEITVVANTVAGKTFHEWTVGGEVVSTNSSYTFTLEEDVSLMAEYELSLSANTRVTTSEWSKFVDVENWHSSGKLLTIDFKPSTDSGSFAIYLETSENVRVASTITVQYSGSSTHGFVDSIGGGWYRLTIELNNMGIRSGYDGTETISQVYLRDFTADTSVVFYGINTSVTATYYTVALVGAGTGSTGAGTYLAGRSVTVTPGTIANKTFRKWTLDGEVVSTNSSYTFTLNGNVSLMAEYELSLSANTRVTTSEWSKFVDVENWHSSGKLLTIDFKPSTDSGSFAIYLETSENVRVASTITVQYSGSSTHGFVDSIGGGWYRLTIELNKMGIASNHDGSETISQVYLRAFTADTSVVFYEINTSVTATYYTVTLSGAGTGSTGAGSYLAGRSVTVTPGTRVSATFSEWRINGVQVSTNLSYTFTPSGDVTLTAVFVDYYTVTVNNGTGGDEFFSGTEVTVNANTPDTGYYFLYWKDSDNEIVSTDVSYTFIVMKDVELTAIFRAYDGDYYDGSSTIRLNVPASKAYSTVSFEYKFSTSNSSSIRFKICDGDEDEYYGSYSLYINGITGDGITITNLSDGYIRVSMIFELLTTHTGTPNPVAKIKIDKNQGECFYIRNVIWEESPSFSMLNGASIRTGSPNGIKFTAKIPVSLYDSEADYGMIILPYDLIEVIIGFDFDADIIAQLDAAGVTYRRFSCTPVATLGVGYIIQASITNIKASNIDRGFIGIGFKYKNSTYTYAEFSENIESDNVRSVSYVADKFLLDHDNFSSYSESCQEYVMGILGSDDTLAVGKLTVNAFDSIENFRKNDTVPTSSTLTLSAAKGESEFGQIILTSTASLDNKTYIVLARDLVHTDGTTVLSSDKIELFNGNYVNVTQDYDYYGSNQSPSATTTEKGYFVDGLTPFYAAVNYEETKFNRTNGANHAVYARFNIPLNQKAGVYSGAFKIYVVGEGYKDLNVQFTVYDFTMYDTESDDVNGQNNFASNFYVRGEALSAMFGCTSKNYSDEYEEAYEYILDYNLNGGEVPYDMYYTTGINGYIEKLVEYYNNPKVRTIRLDLVTGEVSYSYKKTSSSSYLTYTIKKVIYECDWAYKEHTIAGAKTLLKAIAEYCIAHDINLFEKFFVGIQGEPNTVEKHISSVLSFNAVKNSIDYVLNNAGINWTGHDDIKESLRTMTILGTTTAFITVEDAFGEWVYGMKQGNKLVDDVYYKYAYYKSDSYNEATEITINYDYVDSFSPPYHCLYGSTGSTDPSTHKADSYAIALLNDNVDTTHIWWYGCVSPSNPYQNYAINADHVITRGNTWAMYALGIEGEVYWSVCSWKENDSTYKTEAEAWNGECNTNNMMGDGALLLPNVERYARYSDDFKFCPTYRLCVTSESIDDYNYICYAQSLINAMASGSAKTTAQNNLNSYIAAVYNNSSVTNMISNSASTIRTARANIADLIADLIG